MGFVGPRPANLRPRESSNDIGILIPAQGACASASGSKAGHRAIGIEA